MTQMHHVGQTVRIKDVAMTSLMQMQEKSVMHQTLMSVELSPMGHLFLVVRMTVR
jgi:hypothetical protein